MCEDEIKVSPHFTGLNFNTLRETREDV